MKNMEKCICTFSVKLNADDENINEKMDDSDDQPHPEDVLQLAHRFVFKYFLINITDTK